MLLGVWFGLWKTNDALVFFPLTALFQKFDTFETLKNAALGSNSAGAFQARMLTHTSRENIRSEAKCKKKIFFTLLLNRKKQKDFLT